MFSTSLLPLHLLKKDRYVVDHILWDFEHRQLMQSSFKTGGASNKPAVKSAGYIFYIETMDKKPGLFLMIQNASGHAETLAKIADVPDELISDAIEENKEKKFSGMYPISRKMADWLKKELAVQGD
jgi:hypothetical protein